MRCRLWVLQDIAARRKELLERERKRRADAAAKRVVDAKSQHQKLVEKQKQDRINKGREQWRSNLLGEYISGAAHGLGEHDVCV